MADAPASTVESSMADTIADTIFMAPPNISPMKRYTKVMRRDRLRQALDHAAHLLPMQGPIGVFVHHNTLHAFQDSPFEEAVLEAAQLFGAEPYMSEAD